LENDILGNAVGLEALDGALTRATGATGAAASTWPMFLHDARQTGRLWTIFHIPMSMITNQLLLD